jgi:tetratricopeptide (TPR) repeat protein
MMGQALESTLPADEQYALGQIIDQIGSEKPYLLEAIRLCAVPRWFNDETLAWLRDKASKPSQETETILEEMTSKKLAFAGPERLLLHDNVRNLLLHRWRTENPEGFQALNGEVAVYYEYKLQQPAWSDEQRAEWEREEMYHLLVADTERGIDRFKTLCNQAIDSYRLSTLDLLLSLASEQINDLSAGIQCWIQFFEGKKSQVSSDWKKALTIWEKLKEKREAFTADLECALAIHLSILYKDRGEWSRAIECLNQSLEILEHKGDQSGVVAILNTRGFLYKDKEAFEDAEDDFKRGIKVSEDIGEKRDAAVSLKNLGLLYKDIGKWTEALEQFQSSLSILERIGDERSVARGYDDRGLLYKDRGLLSGNKDDFQRAEDDFKHALEIMERIGGEPEKAAAFSSLGLFYKDRGLRYKDNEDLQKAENSFHSAREILERIGDQRRIADTFNYLGFLCTAALEWHNADVHFERALTNFQRSLTILKELGDERGTAVILSNLGLLYQRTGDQQSAISYFKQSLEIVEKICDEMNAATTMYELALVYDSMKQFDKAIELLEEVVKISEQVGHPDARIRKSREMLTTIRAKAGASQPS